MINKKVLEAYRDGSSLETIQSSFNLTKEQIKNILIQEKENNRFKRTFTDDFKRIIAERDTNGIPRRQISLELEISVNTVKKACEQFGQVFKERASSDNAFTRIERELDMTTCASCGSKKVNLVEENTTYCLSCGSEHIHHKDHVLRVNWEYLDD